LNHNVLPPAGKHRNRLNAANSRQNSPNPRVGRWLIQLAKIVHLGTHAPAYLSTPYSDVRSCLDTRLTDVANPIISSSTMAYQPKSICHRRQPRRAEEGLAW